MVFFHRQRLAGQGSLVNGKGAGFEEPDISGYEVPLGKDHAVAGDELG